MRKSDNARMQHTAILAAFAVSCASCANLFAHLTYVQTLDVQFADAKTANEAQARIEKFPGGKKIAYTTRWDDSNPRQLPLSKMLNARGMKATCYPNAVNSEYAKILKQMLESGNAVGSHTRTHPLLGMLMPAEIFMENAMQRIELESLLDANVAASALPFHNYATAINPKVAHITGMSILNAGYLSAPDLVENRKKYSLPEGADIFSTSLFDANDSNPDEKRYASGLKRAIEKAEQRGDNHITLGVHSTQREGGIERLGEIIDKYDSAEFWHCTENEYAAYRAQAESAKIEKTGTKGNVASFKIARPAATKLASDIPLSLSFSAPIKSAKLDGNQLPAKGEAALSTALSIPHPPQYLTPKKIDHVKIPFGSAKFIQSKKFPELRFSMGLDKESEKLDTSMSCAGAKVENLQVTYILAPCFERAADAFSKTPNAEFKTSLKLKKNELAEFFDEGEMLYAVQLDFLLSGQPSRVYLTTVDSLPVQMKNCPRDLGAAIGSLPAGEADENAIRRMSKPGTPLADMLGKSWEFTRSKKHAPYALLLAGKKVRTSWKADALTLAVVDFIAPNAGEYELITDNIYARAYLINGEEVKLKSGSNKIRLNGGKNRILAKMMRGVFTLSVRDSKGAELEYCAPEIRGQ